MLETAGTKLRRARQMRQQSLEDAARATKIRANQLADLEADEYSNFANLAYARNYLVNYAKYLRVDVRPYLEAFSDASTFGMDDYQYLRDKPVGVYRIPYRRPGRRRRPVRRQLVGAALGLAALAVGIFGWIAAVNIKRLGPLDTLAQRQAAAHKVDQIESVAPAATTAASTVVAPTAAIPAASPASGIFGPAEKGSGSDPAGTVIPVSAPAQPLTTETPAPSVAPVPANAPVSIPALATNSNPNTVTPVLPLSGDGRSSVRELFTTVHGTQPQPQKVVNDHARGQ